MKLRVITISLLLAVLLSCGTKSTRERFSLEPEAYTDDTVYVKPDHTILATSIKDLQDKINNAQAGDVIALKNGVYTDVNINVLTGDIAVVAETSGSVFIEGVSQVVISADNVVLEGFYFRNGYPISDKGAINVIGSHCRVTNCTIDSFNDSDKEVTYKWLSLDDGSTYNEVDHCTFTGKRTEGTILVVWRQDDQPQYHHIHRNIFSDYQYVSSDDKKNDKNGWETIRIGTSHQSQSSSYTTVEYNYFYKCDGEIEIISNKSGHNVYQYNTFDSCVGGLTLRHGFACTVKGNYIDAAMIKDTSGIRIIDKDHIIEDNYIEGVRTSSKDRGAICISSSQIDPKLNGYWLVDNVMIKNNTIINSQQPFLYGSSAKQLPPKNITFKDNLIRNNINNEGNFSIVRIVHRIPEAIYEGNIYFGGSHGMGGQAPDGLEEKEVELTQNSNGQYIYVGKTVGAPALIRLDSSLVGAKY